MSASHAKVNEVTYVTSDAIHATIMSPDGEAAYYVIVVESDGFALVQPCGEAGWEEVYLGDLDLSDADSLDEIIAAVIDEAFEPSK